MKSKRPRLDLLIYAHDGRGLGHVSRSIAIGAAVRRLYPEARILLITGYRHTQSLVGPVPLDWIKLPGYTKQLVDGNPVAQVGPTNFKNSYLVRSRTRLIRFVVDEFRPRCVLVDHEPCGKREELIPAIESGRDRVWVLGIRAVVGNVQDVWSPSAAAIFKTAYSALVWYGDQALLGGEAAAALKDHFNRSPHAVGYVSRLKELQHWRPPDDDRGMAYAGTIAVPWAGEDTRGFLYTLQQVLTDIGDRHGPWRLFLDTGRDLFEHLPFCRVSSPGQRYLKALARSKMAIVYGGYNSVTDLLVTGIPAVVLVRRIVDREQELHLAKLTAIPGSPIVSVAEAGISAPALKNVIEKRLQASSTLQTPINVNGAEETARILARYFKIC